jgi:hypothetical protein
MAAIDSRRAAPINGNEVCFDSPLERVGFELRVPLPEKRRSDAHHGIRALRDHGEAIAEGESAALSVLTPREIAPGQICR